MKEVKGETNPLYPIEGILRDARLLNLLEQFRNDVILENLLKLAARSGHVGVKSEDSNGEDVERRVETVDVVDTMAVGKGELIIVRGESTDCLVDRIMDSRRGLVVSP